MLSRRKIGLGVAALTVWSAVIVGITWFIIARMPGIDAVITRQADKGVNQQAAGSAELCCRQLAEAKALSVYAMTFQDYASRQSQLQDMKHKDVDPCVLQELLPHLAYQNTKVLWKGDRLALLTLADDTVLPLRMSVYGGFFSIDGEEGYYAFPEETYRDKWEEATAVRVRPEHFDPNKGMEGMELLPLRNQP